MTRVTRRRNIRLEIFPAVPETGSIWGRPYEQDAHEDRGPETEQRFMAEATRIQQGIARHVDDATAALRYDSIVECSFCSYAFASDETADLMPWCCDAAQREFVKAHPEYTGEADDFAEDTAAIRADLEKSS